MYSNEPSEAVGEVEMIRFKTIPEEFPKKMTRNFGRYFGLGQCLLFEMFTVVIFEHLYTKIDSIKRQTLGNLKFLIYDENFMQDNFYTKGMLIEGFRQM